MKIILATALILFLFVASASAGSFAIFEWTAIEGATGYKLYQSTIPGVYNKVTGIVCKVTGYTCIVSNIPDGRYYWVVTAYNSEEETPYSNEVSARLVSYWPHKKVK